MWDRPAISSLLEINLRTKVNQPCLHYYDSFLSFHRFLRVNDMSLKTLPPVILCLSCPSLQLLLLLSIPLCQCATMTSLRATHSSIRFFTSAAKSLSNRCHAHSFHLPSVQVCVCCVCVIMRVCVKECVGMCACVSPSGKGLAKANCCLLPGGDRPNQGWWAISLSLSLSYSLSLSALLALFLSLPPFFWQKNRDSLQSPIMGCFWKGEEKGKMMAKGGQWGGGKGRTAHFISALSS